MNITQTLRYLLLAACVFAGPATAQDIHSRYDQLLQASVTPLRDGKASEVNYSWLADNREILQNYLQELSRVSQSQFDSWSEDDQLAFLINAYNAWTLELIVKNWPDIRSIKETGSLFRSPWRIEFVNLLGEMRSLDNIEHQLIRGPSGYQDPRIHFAVNCASIGCPALRWEVYTGIELGRQLDEQTRLFLADKSRNRYEGGKLLISPIFKWYREDFEKGWLGYQSLAGFLADYSYELSMPPAAEQALVQGRIDIEFTDYDWALNN